MDKNGKLYVGLYIASLLYRVPIFCPEISQLHCFKVVCCGGVALYLQEFLLGITGKNILTKTKEISSQLPSESSGSPKSGKWGGGPPLLIDVKGGFKLALQEFITYVGK